MEIERIFRRRRYLNPSERRQVTKQFERSGLTCRDFARRHHLSLSSLTRWLSEARRPPDSESPVVFSEVTISPPLSPLLGTAWAVELIGRDGITIRLRDELQVRDLVELLRGKAC